MKHLTLIYALCAQFFIIGSAAESTQDCPQTPLLQNNGICLAPLDLIQKETHLFTDRKWQWKSDRPAAWDGPYDCIDKYCVFVNHQLDGMVLISAEQNVHVIDRFQTAPRNNTPPPTQQEPPPFYVADIPGKGIGLIANRTIRTNDILMRLTPTMLIQLGPHLDIDAATRAALYERAVERIPEPRRSMFRRQHGRTTYEKIDRNSFRMFINGEENFSGHLGVYPEASRMNHDCRPNIHYRIENITHISVAVRDIHPGEELTVSYIDGLQPRAERQSRLSDWGFACTCAHCRMSDAEAAASDTRMERIQNIEGALEKMMASGSGIDPRLGDELVRLLHEERLESYLGQAYTRAALLHSLVGNGDEAVRYARLAREALIREFGERSKDAKAMNLLAEEPEKHWSWGALKVAEKGMEKKADEEDENWVEGVGTQVKVELTGNESKGGN
ncbi:SET domain-containing protein 5 [Echria macrotheca]|uniref:SET domain-containing protein 5 n=1 Tax=Echria macrotheca TaxID=438768 RepID=A0AAJ0BGH4_9PEZI|nr:SET domain-containing protein 5 [Echria macrotheca]